MLLIHLSKRPLHHRKQSLVFCLHLKYRISSKLSVASPRWSAVESVAAANQEPVSVSMSSVSSPSERQISSNASSDRKEAGSGEHGSVYFRVLSDVTLHVQKYVVTSDIQDKVSMCFFVLFWKKPDKFLFFLLKRRSIVHRGGSKTTEKNHLTTGPEALLSQCFSDTERKYLTASRARQDM